MYLINPVKTGKKGFNYATSHKFCQYDNGGQTPRAQISVFLGIKAIGGMKVR